MKAKYFFICYKFQTENNEFTQERIGKTNLHLQYK
jgi:hypothetical protein